MVEVFIVNVFILSNNYSPGYYSHLKAYYKIFKDMGFNPFLYIDRAYKFFLDNDNEKMNYYYTDNLYFDERPEIVLFVNPCINMHKKAKYFKEILHSKIIYVYHEPWDGLINYLVNEKITTTFKMIVAHYYSKQMLKVCDAVLVCSKYALKKYELLDKKYNKNVYYLPLLFVDENAHMQDFNRKYFSFIGGATKSRAFDTYLEFVKYNLLHNTNITFQIATRVNIENLIDSDLKYAIKNEQIKIIHGRVLSNEEINLAYKQSFCVWNLYNRSTQSGVLAKSFVFGTPVIASNIGSFSEFVKNYYNGIIQKNNKDFKQLYDNLLIIKDNIDTYSKNARKTFEEIFYYKSNIERLSNIIERLHR